MEATNHVPSYMLTYIQLSKEFVYLAVIIDVFSRRCIGWELSRHIDKAFRKGTAEIRPKIYSKETNLSKSLLNS